MPTKDLQKIRQPLRSGWDLTKFEFGKTRAAHAASNAAGDKDDNDDDEDYMAKVARADVAIRSGLFWGYCSMVNLLGEAVLGLFLWFETCACHSKTKSQCPLKGMKAPHLAAGDLWGEVDELMRQNNSWLWADVCTLPHEQSQIIMEDFALARQCIEMTLRLKLAFWSCLPHALCSLAHEDPEQVRLAAQRALTLYASATDVEKEQPLVQRICGQHQQLLRGIAAGTASLSDDASLETEVAKLRFICVCERHIEGQHASVHRKLAGKPHAGPQFVAWSSVRQSLLDMVFDPQKLEHIAGCCLKVRNRWEAARHFSFESHPDLVRLLKEYGKPREALRKEGSVVTQALLRADPSSVFASIRVSSTGDSGFIPLAPCSAGEFGAGLSHAEVDARARYKTPAMSVSL